MPGSAEERTRLALDEAIPPSFCCSITQDPMHDPFMDAEGNSYEREAIFKWLESNNTSPITRSPFSEDCGAHIMHIANRSLVLL